MENIEKDLQNLIEMMNDSIFSGIVGSDGLPVFLFSKENLNKSETSAETASIFNVIKKEIINLDFGKLEEVFIITDKYAIVINPVCDDYFLILGLQMPTNIGRARLELKKIMPRIEEMMK